MSYHVRLATGVFMVAALMVLAGCSSEVSGRVVGASTGNPIPGAVVTVSDVTTTTAADGSFAVRKINWGRTSGEVKVPGYPESKFTIATNRSGPAPVVKIPDSTLRVTVTETAVEPKDVDEFEILVDGLERSSVAELWPLQPGEHQLVVRSKGHEDHESMVTLKPGANEVAVVLSLTPEETYERFFQAGRARKDAVSYKYLHPDERKNRLSFSQWKSWCSVTKDRAIKIHGVRMLKEWKSGYVGEVFENVAEVDRTLRYRVIDPKRRDVGMMHAERLLQHWVKLDGRWYLVHAKGPK